jgi:NAD(P)H-hydrate repair Nnr-like enzyme with NAD(P)H-hydrate dehydratase domain
MLAVVGTIPDQSFPIVAGEVALVNNQISIQGKYAFVNRGTTALLGSAIKAGEVLNQPKIFAYLVGDIDIGDGSRRLYKYMVEDIHQHDFHTIVFHYIMPYVKRNNDLLSALGKMKNRPILIADAGTMYVAKMSGNALSYDLFTPDVGELAFLSDETAPHPIYTRGFILHEDNKVPDLIARAYANNNAARYLLVKGAQDYVSDKEKVIATIDNPMVEAMEAIGGTGDTLTGIVAALIANGMEIKEAAIVAAKANRLAGYYASPTPATQVLEVIEQIPRALRETLR